MKYLLLLFPLTLLIACQPQASEHAKDLVLSPLFSDGMVLQQQTEAAFWGEAAPHEEITLSGSWGANAAATADEKGAWNTHLKTPKAGGPFQVEIKTGSGAKTIQDVLIGEVWLAAGQSNMEMDFAYCCNTTDHAETELKTANFPEIRMLNVQKQLSKTPTKAFEGRWEAAIGEKITHFSAAGYFFAKRLHTELNVPIGIIHSSWGGTDVEAWTSREKLSSLGNFEEELAAHDSLARNSDKSEAWFSAFEAVPLPSDVWFLFTGDYFGFPEKWKTLDFRDETYLSPTYDAKDWPSITLPGAFDEVFGTNDFDGVILVKKTFTLGEIKGPYKIELGPVSNMDFTYINGVHLGTRFGKESGKALVYDLPDSLLKVGENTLTIRVLNNYGPGEIGAIKFISSKSEKLLAGGWKYRVSGEIYRQMDNYTWPYTALYLYDKEGIDFTQRPPVHKYHPNVKSSLYNGMINPLIPYALKGAIWYQGENNVSRYEAYERLFPAMITDWRERWEKDFPLYFVQIAPFYNYGGISSSLRDAQRKSLHLPNTGMVVTLDIGEYYDIHPANKHDVGSRLAGLALADNYGGQTVASGPLFKAHEVKGDKIWVSFDHIGSGLVLKENKEGDFEFEIAGENQQFVKADAKIVGEHIEVFSPAVSKPLHVRYGWSDTTAATLFNKEGLPGSSFSSN